MIDFYKTEGGRRFIDGTVPEVARQLKRIADTLDRLLHLVERDAAATEPANGSPQSPRGQA